MHDVILTSVPMVEVYDAFTKILKNELAILSPNSHPIPISQDSNSDLITRKDAAKLLGVTYPTLNRWTKDGTITGYRINTRVRYKRAELEQCLKTICKLRPLKCNKTVLFCVLSPLNA